MKKREKEKWVIFGIGNFIFDIIECINLNNGEVIEVVVNIETKSSAISDLPKGILITNLDAFRPREGVKYFFGFVDPKKEEILKKINKKNLDFSNLVHPFSFISSKAKMGKGNYLGPGVVVAPNVKLGNFNILNRNSSIGHDTIIGDMNHIAPGATVSGRCKICNKILVGAGAVLLDGQKVVDRVTIGAGSVVLKSIEVVGTYVGSPARKIK